MNATIAEALIGQKEIGHENIGNAYPIYDQITEVDSADDDLAFVIIDGLMTLMVYLAPVAVFGYMVAPVVARLLSMPVSN
jgi:hypothetical protein